MKSIKFRLFLLLIFFSFGCKIKDSNFILDPEIKEINVIMDNNYPPYVFVDQNNNLIGILIDQWKLWGKKTGVRVNIVATDWIEAQNLMKSGKFDVIDTIFKTEERLKIYDYSKPYAKLDVPIFYHKNISGIINANSLKGFTTAVKEGDACIDFLKKHSINHIIEYKSYEEIIKAAKKKDIVVFLVDEPPALYFMYKYGIQNDFKNTEPLYTGEFHRAVLKGNKRILSLVEYGFDLITKKEYESINKKWFGTNRFEFKQLKYILFFMAILFLLYVLLITWNFSLKKVVNIRTIELKKEIEKNKIIQKELEESEELYKLLSEITSDAASLLTLKQDGSFDREWFTIGVLKEYGYQIEEIDSFEKWAKIVYPEDLTKFKNAVNKILNGEKISEDLRIVTKDNKIRWINNTVYPIVNKETKKVGKILNSIKDITEKKRIEEELQIAKEVAERNAHIKSNFLSNMSHEIRNPLNGILGMINMLSKTTLTEQQKEYVELLKNSSEVLLNIVNDILDISKIEAGKKVIKNEIIKLKNFCHNIINSFKIAADKKLKLEFIYDNELPRYIKGDVSCLNHILISLLSNAIKFTEQGKITVEVKKIKEEDNNIEVLFSVKDSGIGIPKDKIDEIFNRFIQLDTSYTKKYKGTGLGLAIVKEIVNLLKGEILVESEENKGSNFLIKLKFEKYSSEFVNISEEKKEVKINERDYNILIAEDNVINLLFLETILKKRGYKVFTTKNGSDVLEVIEKNRIDLILMDIQMPIINGVDCSKILRKEKNFINPIIAITGYTMEEDLKIFKEAGINDYFIKPIEEGIVLEKIAKLLLTLNK